MIHMLLDILSWALILGGGFFLIVAGIGLVRLPDVYTRLHAAGIPDTMGGGLLLLGLMLQVEPGIVTIKLAMIFIFMFFTTPTATHALANVLHHSSVKPLLTESEVMAKEQDR